MISRVASRFIGSAITLALLTACASDASLPRANNISRLSIHQLVAENYIYATGSHVPGEIELDNSQYVSEPSVAVFQHVAVSVFSAQQSPSDGAFAVLTARTTGALLAMVESNIELEIEVFLVPEGQGLHRRYIVLRLPGQPFKVRFYVSQDASDSFPLERAGQIAHEIYHLVRPGARLFATLGNRVDEETAAVILSTCAQLTAAGAASFRSEANGSFTDDGRIARRFGPLDDELLRRWLRLVDENSSETRNDGSFYVGAMTLWMSYSNSEWDIIEDTPAADRLRAACAELLVDQRNSRSLLHEIANDGDDVRFPDRRPSDGLSPPSNEW